MKAADWIDRVKSTHGWESDYRVAKELGLSRATVSSYRSRTPTLDEDSAVKVAHALGIDPVLILADQALERAKNEEARSAWAVALQRLGGVAASIFLVAGLGGGGSGSADAATLSSSQIKSSLLPQQYTLYEVKPQFQPPQRLQA